MSRELILRMSVSLDGFVADANGKNDWIFRNRSEASTKWLAERFGEAGLIAMGQKSYQEMADFWPTANSPFARPMNQVPKAVFSRSGTVSRPSMEKTEAALKEGAVDQAVMEGWLHPLVAGKDLAGDIQKLKAEEGKPIVVLGGASFASSLIAANLVDAFRLVVHPVALGRGLPVFADLEAPLYLKLEDLQQFESGVVVKTYIPA